MHIYCVTNTVNGKRYVGQTIQSVAVRFAQHKYENSRRDGLLTKAIEKYGFDNFTVEILESVTTQQELDLREAFWIAELKTLAHSGYNLEAGGRGKGAVHEQTRARMKEVFNSPEVVAKKSAAAKITQNLPEVKAMMAALRETPEAKVKHSAAMQAAMARPEVRRKISAASRAAQSTPEAKERISAKSLEMWMRPAMRAKRAHTDAKAETKAARSAAAIERSKRPEWKERRSAAMRAAWARKTDAEKTEWTARAKHGHDKWLTERKTA